MKNISEVDYCSEMSDKYLSYSMSVILERALPSVQDGLKPVQRRVLYASSQLTKSDTPHRKSARIVGDTMGRFHPHGDSSIYEALVNLAQDWKATPTLIDSHGNFGAEDGSGAAAMRYTEARVSEYTEKACLKDLKYMKDTFIPNFENTESEPTVLPFLVPNILVNGSVGIAVGMATNIPTHNLGEVIDATTLYLEKDGDVTTDELLEIMPGPDFATGGCINASYETLLNIYETGLGKIKVRGKVDIRDLGYGKRSICIVEIPYTMIGGIEKFMYQVATLCRSKDYRILDKIDDISDRSSKSEICIALDLKRGTTDEEIEQILSILYKKTILEDTYGVNLNCLHGDGKVGVLSLKEIFKQYTDFKKDVYNTKYSQLLTEQEKILEVKQGLREAVDIIDLIIEILRGSKSKADAKNCLMNGNIDKIKFRFKGSEEDAKKLHFTERQTDAILSMQLSQLIGLELKSLEKDISAAESLIRKYSGLLSSPKKMCTQMIEDMQEVRNKFATPRRTVIQNFGEVEIKQEEATPEPVAVLIDRFYYIKVIDRALYDKNIEEISNTYRKVILCQNTERLALFTSDNQMHMLKVSDLVKQIDKKNPKKVKAKLSDKGIQIFECFDIPKDCDILFADSIENFASQKLFMMFGNGYAKRVDGSAFDVSRKNTQFAKEDLRVVSICVADDNEQIVAYTKNGYFIRTAIENISVQGKMAGGVRVLRIQDDEVEYAVSGSVSSSFSYQGNEYPFTRVKLSNRDNKGIKLRF